MNERSHNAQQQEERMFVARNRKHRGFSLIELVIVVVIIGIIAAIAIPRMSRGAAGAGDSALASNLATLRKAIELYAAEHDGAFPTKADIVDQLTKFTDATGKANATKTSEYIFGPYLRSIPMMNAGAHKGKDEVTDTAGKDGGWVYNELTGEIHADADATEADVTGKLYTDY